MSALIRNISTKKKFTILNLEVLLKIPEFYKTYIRQSKLTRTSMRPLREISTTRHFK